MPQVLLAADLPAFLQKKDLVTGSNTMLKWGEPTIGTPSSVIRYHFLDREKSLEGVWYTPENNCGHMIPLREVIRNADISLETVKSGAERAMARWSRVARITFVPAFGEEDADLIIGGTRKGAVSKTAEANLQLQPEKTGALYTIVRGVVCLSADKQWQSGRIGDRKKPAIETVIGHEVGHIIGLDHPGSIGALMGYLNFGDPDLQRSDIDGVRKLYGARSE